jgi:mono/diheme cytochrome c family protein
VIRLLWTALILTQTQGEAPLSSFQKAKAEALLRDRLPCLGCHELNGEGGRIGPSLSELQHFRTPEYVSSMIRDPQATAPGSIMPRVPMPQATLELVASYLVELAARRYPQSARVQAAAPPPATRTAEPAPDPTPPLGAAALYGRFCAACHGDRGRADGFNVPYLPVRPTAHADSAYMSRRSDDALFDATYAGGFIMNRSNRMPPFGQTLTRDQIWELVRYLRTLCRCEGPAWARDNQ